MRDNQEGGNFLTCGKKYLLKCQLDGALWVGSGEFVGVIPAGTRPSPEVSLACFGKTDTAPAQIARYVFRKENGSYSVLPDSSNSEVIERP